MYDLEYTGWILCFINEGYHRSIYHENPLAKKIIIAKVLTCRILKGNLLLQGT